MISINLYDIEMIEEGKREKRKVKRIKIKKNEKKEINKRMVWINKLEGQTMRKIEKDRETQR